MSCLPKTKAFIDTQTVLSKAKKMSYMQFQPLVAAVLRLRDQLLAAIVVKIQPLRWLFLSILQPVAAAPAEPCCGVPQAGAARPTRSCSGETAVPGGGRGLCVGFGTLLQSWIQVGTRTLAVLGSGESLGFGGLTPQPGSRFEKESATGAGPAACPSVRPHTVQYCLLGPSHFFLGGRGGKLVFR